MKKLYTLAILFLTAAGVYAQAPVIDQSDIGSVGSTYNMGRTGTIPGGVDEGSAGAGQSWDYSAIPSESVDSVRFWDPVLTPGGADFPTSNLAIYSMTNGGYAYVQSTASKMELLGLSGDPFGVGATMSVQMNPTRTITPFPLTYGTAWIDSSGIDFKDTTSLIPFVDSVRYKNITTYNSSGDAWGTLKLYGGTYTALRVRTVESAIDSIWIHSLLGWSLISDSMYTDSSFTWWGETRGYLLCEVAYAGPDISTITYLDPNFVGVDDPAALAATVMYPNPTSGVITLGTEQAYGAEAEICSLTGQTLLRQPVTGNHTQMDLSSLPSGFYLCRVRSAEGNILSAGKISLMK